MKAHIADVAASFSRWLATRTEGWTAHEKLALHARIAEALGAGPDPAAGNLGINVTLETYTSDGDAEYEQRGASTHLKINHGYMVLGFAHPGTDLAGRDVTELANVHIEHKTDR